MLFSHEPFLKSFYLKIVHYPLEVYFRVACPGSKHHSGEDINELCTLEMWEGHQKGLDCSGKAKS